MNKKIGKYDKRDFMAYLYITPWLVGLVVLQIYPFVSSLLYSFTDFTILSVPKFIGLNNYITLFTSDREFVKSLLTTFTFTIYTVPGKLLLALAVAVFLNREIKGINLIRTIFYIPSLFGGSIAIAILWKLMFMNDGIINAILQFLHLPAVAWLGDPKVALKTISLLEIWQFGSSMVIFLAALKQVPKSLYEAAQLDGANKIMQFLKITLPQITPIIFFNLIMQTINALQSFTSAFVITNGGPMKSTYVLGMKLYNEAFAFFKMGYASAISWIIFLIVLVITVLLFRSSSGWVYYEDEGEF